MHPHIRDNPGLRRHLDNHLREIETANSYGFAVGGELLRPGIFAEHIADTIQEYHEGIGFEKATEGTTTHRELIRYGQRLRISVTEGEKDGFYVTSQSQQIEQ